MAMQEVDRFATNHKKQIGKLEIHFATIAYWAGKCYGNEVSVPVHRMSACAPVGCPTKTENYLASCFLLLAAPMECHVPSFQQLSKITCSFFKRYAVSSKRPKKIHLEGKLLLSCLQKKNPTKKQNRECILFPAKLAITYFCSSSLATC